MRESSTSSQDAATSRPVGPAPEHLGGSGRDTALLGDILVYAARLRGVSGIVLQGLVRDEAALAAQGLPVFTSGATARGPVKKALAAGQTTVDILGLRAKLPQ